VLVAPVAQNLAEAGAAPAPAPATATAAPLVSEEEQQQAPLSSAAPAPAPGVNALGGKKVVYAAPLLAAAPISGARPAPPLSFPAKRLVVEPKSFTIPKVRLVKEAPVPVS